MAKPNSKKRAVTPVKAYRRFCSQPAVRTRAFTADVHPGRAEAIISNDKKWANGTELTYGFLGGPDSQKAAMRRAFDVWKNIGIGITFRETADADEATVRIAFANDGSWSYVGRDVREIQKPEPTMNIGWDISGDLDTGVHEIGHTLGLQHEHQNPNAGIVWDEEAVYTALAAPPNRWSRATTFNNIIAKLDPRDVTGTTWDPNSIMHYPFEAGLIVSPPTYANGLQPAGGLSPLDIQWIRTAYPKQSTAPTMPVLEMHKMVPLKAATGQQVDFSIKPGSTDVYDMQTFGNTDAVLVLVVKEGDRYRYLAGDDDSGYRYNAHLQQTLTKGKEYVLRARMLYAPRNARSHIMLW